MNDVQRRANEALAKSPEIGDAKAEIAREMRDRIDTISALQKIAGGDAESPEQAVELGLDELAEAQVLYDEAEDRLREFPLAVEKTVQFEIVLGTGGPDDRIVVECSHDGRGVHLSDGYEIRCILYRYSWTGSAEVELTGEDREVAEAFARRVVPELAE